jgi:hypothetical protein
MIADDLRPRAAVSAASGTLRFMFRLLFVDETTAGARDTAFALDVPGGSLPLRDVIRARIHEEVARGLKVDAEAQCEAAFQAFARNGFLVLVGDRQITDLDEPVTGQADVEVTFLKLIPLVGG